MIGPFRSHKLRQFTARLLLTLGLLPTGPVMGLGAIAPADLGLQVTEAAPKLGPHIRLTQRTTSLELARQAARGAWLGISAKVDGVVLPAKIFGKGKKLQERAVRAALEALERTPQKRCQKRCHPPVFQRHLACEESVRGVERWSSPPHAHVSARVEAKGRWMGSKAASVAC